MSQNRRAGQAVITTKTNPDPNLYQNRLKRTNKLNRNQVYGSLSETSTDISASDLVFTFKGGNAHSTKSVFSSFTGIPTKGMSQDEFEDQFILIGRAESNFDTHSNREQTGLTVQTSGANYILHTGNKKISAGNEVEWYLENVDSEERQRQKGSYRAIKGQSSDKLVARIREYQAANILRLPRNAFFSVIQNPQNSSISLLDPNNRNKISKELQYGLYLKKYIMGIVATAVTNLVKRDILEIKAPQNPLDASSYDEKNANYSIDIEDLFNSKIQNNGGQVQLIGRDAVKEESELQWLYTQLGLISYQHQQPHLIENYQMTQELFAMTNLALFEIPTEQQKYQLSNFFSNTQAQLTSNGQKYFNQSTVAGQITKIQHDSYTTFAKTNALATVKSRAQIFGRIFQNASPNENIPIDMN